MKRVLLFGLLCAAGSTNAGIVTLNYSGIVDDAYWNSGSPLVSVGDEFFGAITYREEPDEAGWVDIIGGFTQFGSAPMVQIVPQPNPDWHVYRTTGSVNFWTVPTDYGVWSEWYMEDWIFQADDHGGHVTVSGYSELTGLDDFFGVSGSFRSLIRIEHPVSVPEPGTAALLALSFIGAGYARRYRGNRTHWGKANN